MKSLDTEVENLFKPGQLSLESIRGVLVELEAELSATRLLAFALLHKTQVSQPEILQAIDSFASQSALSEGRKDDMVGRVYRIARGIETPRQ